MTRDRRGQPPGAGTFNRQAVQTTALPCPRHRWHALGHWYFEPRSFERAGDCRLYRLLGVRSFKRYLPTSGDLVSRWRGVSRVRRAEGGLALALCRHERVTRSYEARHILGGLAMLAISWWAITFHGKGQWPALIIANLFINGYPIILQRYNRIRLQNALVRLAALRARHVGQERQRGSSDPPGPAVTDRNRTGGVVVGCRLRS